MAENRLLRRPAAPARVVLVDLVLPIALALGSLGGARAAVTDSALACPRTGGETATIAAVLPRLELRLADGRILRLAGLDPAAQTPGDPDRAETSRAALAAMLADRPVAIAVLAKAPDRWGRVVAMVFLPGGPEGGIAAAAIAAGLGRYRAEPAAHACRGALAAAEDGARQAKLGLWADPYYAVLDADDQAAFAERSGTIVVAEARLTAVVPGPYRTKLRFAARDPSRGGAKLSATILPRTLKTFEAQRVKLASLVGRTLRLRGLLDLRFGPRIELAGPDDLDVVGGASDASPSRGTN